MTAAISSSPNIPKPAASRASLALPTAASKGASSFLDIEYLLMSLQFEEIGREHGVDLKVPHLYRLDHLSVFSVCLYPDRKAALLVKPEAGEVDAVDLVAVFPPDLYNGRHFAGGLLGALYFHRPVAFKPVNGLKERADVRLVYRVPARAPHERALGV